jgi:poly(beta-D-mannuronate) lyase
MKKIIVAIFLLASVQTWANKLIVSNTTELLKSGLQANAGDTVVIKSGSYANCNLIFSAKGTKEKPIVFLAEKPGTVFITGSSYLHISGNYITISGIVFKDGYAGKNHVWQFNHGNEVANHCRITASSIQSFNNSLRLDENHWITFSGKHNRVDHCNFTNKTNLGVLVAVLLDDDRSRTNDHLIDSNYFGIRKPLGSNAGEMIRVGVSQHCTFYSNTIIKNNFFEYCDGETEIISVKSCGNKVVGNVFKECQGAVVLRHGNNNTIEGNLFYGNDKEGTGGVRVINEGNWIVNNFMSHCKGQGFRSPLAIMAGVFNSPANRYLPVRDAVIANNTFLNCSPFSISEGKDAERSVDPKNVLLLNNLFYNNTPGPLCYTVPTIDSVYAAGNVFSAGLTNPGVQGFTAGAIGMQKWDSKGFPVIGASGANNTTKKILDSLNAIASTRGVRAFSNTIGTNNLNYFKALLANAPKLGNSWESKKVSGANASTTTSATPGATNTNATSSATNSQKTTTVSTANELEAAISAGAHSKIILKAGTYTFLQPIVIKSSITISSNGAAVNFATSSGVINLFTLQQNAQLNLQNVSVNAAGLTAQNFIAVTSDGTGIHNSINITGSKIFNFSGAAILMAPKSSYLDNITIENSSFENNKATLLSLKDEDDNKGYYNAERIAVTNNSFVNHAGQLAVIYRGGNDESTMGPIFSFSANKMVNCTSNGALIELFGVQQSNIYNNQFSSANKGSKIIAYTDNTKAFHYQKNNSATESGTIQENKFVINN